LPVPDLGELCAVGAALSWACAVILFRKSGDTVPPFELTLFKTLLALLIFVPAIPLFGEPLVPAVPAVDWVALLVSGLVGITFADALFFVSLKRLGAGLTAVVDCLYSPWVILLSVLLLGETLGPAQLVGALLVVSAILVGSAGGAPAGTSRRDLLVGLLAGVLSMASMAASVILVKDVLDRAPLLWTTALRLVGGLGGLALLSLVWPRWRGAWKVLRPAPVWRVMIPAVLLGNVVALAAWLAGFKHTSASVAAILNQLSTIFIFLLAAVFLREPLTARRGLAVVLAVSGGILATMFSP